MVLQALRDGAVPMTLAAVSTAISLHPNTVRQHLEALERQGLVYRGKAAVQGRGRPAWQYESAGTDGGGEFPEYVGLSSALAAALHRDARRRRPDAIAAGREWGEDLAAMIPAPSCSEPERARAGAVDLLERLRFGPVTSTGSATVRLTRCPLLAAARQYPEVVCGVHQGVVEGALRHWGEPAAVVRLRPFAEPGACVLTLPPAT